MTTWIIGSNGMLGSEISRLLSIHNEKKFQYLINWNGCEISVDIEKAVKFFFSTLNKNENWTIYWVAGNGSMSSSSFEMEKETKVFSAFVAAVRCYGSEYSQNGAIFFSSSAGAIFASSSDLLITEETVESPNTPYGHEKIKQENLLLECGFSTKIPILIGRITTLYGKMQRSGKQQGLLSHIANSIVRKKAVRIYVPLDTMRDYLYVADAAHIIKSRIDEIMHTKINSIEIIANEKSITVAEIIATFNKVSKKRLTYTCAKTELSILYKKCACFKSKKFKYNEKKTPLTVAIHEILCFEELKYTANYKNNFE